MRKCERCSKEIAEGKSFYEIVIEIKSGFDGVLNSSVLSKEELEEEMKKMGEIYTEEELESQIYRKAKFILCPRCTEIFIANPFLRPLDDLKLPEVI